MPPKSIRYNLGDPDDYNPITLSRRPESELRAEYSRLRRIAQKRIDRIAKSEDFGDSAIVTNNQRWLSVPPSEIPAGRLPSLLSQVEGLLESRTGSLTGLRRQRRASIESLKESGVRGINAQNYGAFAKFMQKTQMYKEAYIPYPKRAKGSEARDAARQIRPKMFMLTQRANISESAIMREFQFFRDNVDRIEKLARSGALRQDRKRSYSANEIRKLLGMEPEKAPTMKQARAEAAAIAPPKKPKKAKRKK